MSFVRSINKENLKIARKNIGISSQSASKKISSSMKDIVADGRLVNHCLPGFK